MRRFRTKKVYGESRVDHCAFCGSIATQTNEQGALVCRHHLQQKIDDIKCTCGSWLEQCSGKFGPYFRCVNCGNINFQKGMEMKGMMADKSLSRSLTASTAKTIVKDTRVSSPVQLPQAPLKESFEERENRIRREERRGRERTITSNDVEYFD